MKPRFVPPASIGRTVPSGLVVVVCVLGVFFWLFGRAVLSDRSFVYRDAAHYYDPLFEFTTSEWAAGRVPLWNPYDGIGKPLLADSTSSVLYPGKLIFALPLAYATKYKLYIVGHLLLAAGAAFVLARRWGASETAAGVCALSYAFGGHVVFQHCNAVFLVGAAWLPFAVGAADRMLRTRRIGWAFVLGGVLALMTLGGDPQTAYNAGVMAAGYALLLWLRQRKFRRRWRAAGPGKRLRGVRLSALISALARHRFTLLTSAALTAGVLAAVQILPSSHWVRQSHRAAYAVPRSVYEIPGYLSRPSWAAADHSPLDGLLARPRAGDHQEHIYYFSVSPWRLVECVWPNISGRQFPFHRRWIEAVPAEGLAWTPTYYMGLLPLMLAIGCLRWRNAPVRVRWMSWSVVFAVLGSFGWYGIGWLIAEFYHACGGDPASLPFGSPAGGLYWLMNVFLPGYVYFRYPAKLLVVAALGMSLLAARGWDRAVVRPAPRLRRSLILLAGVSVAGSAVLLLLRPGWTAWLGGMPPNALFGPFDAPGALTDLLVSLLHTAVVCLLVWCLLPRCSRGDSGRRGSGQRPLLRPSLLLVLTSVELAAAQMWLVPTAPRDCWTNPGPLAAAIGGDQGRDADLGLVRIDRAGPRHWFRPSWSDTSSTERPAEAVVSDNATLMPRFNLRQPIGLLDARGSIESQEFATFLALARSAASARAGRGRYLHPGVQDALAADYAVLHGRTAPPKGFARVAEYRCDDRSFAELWRRGQRLSRVWIADRVVRLDPLPHRDPNSVRRRTNEVLIENGRLRDLRATAVVEMPRPATPTFDAFAARTNEPSAAESFDERCRIVTDEPQRVEIEAELAKPGLLVLSDFFQDGWKAALVDTTSTEVEEKQNLPVVRTNRVMRGVFLPAGRHRVEYRYRPRAFYLGALISVPAWVAMAIAAAIYWRRPPKQHASVGTAESKQANRTKPQINAASREHAS